MLGEYKRSSSLSCLRALVVLVGLCWASLAAAQPRVLVVGGKGVSADAQRAVVAAASEVADVADTKDYTSLARKQHMAPASDAALHEVAPRLRVSLIVLARRERGKLLLSYRDGRSGQEVGEGRFGMPRRGKKDARLHQQLTAAIKAALGGSAPAPSRSTAPPPTAAEEEEPEDSESPEEPAAPPPRAAVREPVASEPETEPEAEPESEPVSGPSEPAVAPGERLRVALGIGAGAAGRSIDLPTREGTRSLSTGMYPGLALSLSAHGMLGSHFRLAAAGDYRTSVGLSAVETPPLDTQRKTSLRSHSLSFGLAPGYRFGDGGGVVLQLHLGWMFQGLRSVVDQAFPHVSWHGFVIRPELIIPFADGKVSLRLAPELVAIAGLSTTLTGRTGLATSGLGFGAELALDIRLSDWLHLGLDYRESHATLGTTWGASFSDVLRFADVRLSLQY